MNLKIVRYSIRSIFTNKLSSIFNLLSLSIGFLVFVSVFTYLSFERSFDDFQKGKVDNLYRLSLSYTNFDGFYNEYAGVSGSIAPLLKEIPEIDAYVRIQELGDKMVKPELSYVNEQELKYFSLKQAWLVDANITDLFEFEALYGSKEMFQETYSGIALSETMSRNIFGEKNPIGEVLRLNEKLNLNVAMVYKDWPQNATLGQPQTMLSSSQELKFNDYVNFIGSGDATNTYVKISDKGNLEEVRSKLSAFLNKHKRPQDYDDTELHLTAFEKLHIIDDYLLGDNNNTVAKRDLNILLVLAFVVMILTLSNSINLTTTNLYKKSKAIAIRRINGETNFGLLKHLAFQALFMITLALFIALILTQVLKPTIQQVIGQGVLNDLIKSPELMMFLIIQILVSLLILTLIPYLLLSNIKIPHLIKGFFNNGKGNVLRRALLLFQFAISAVLMVLLYVVLSQANFLRTLDVLPEVGNAMVIRDVSYSDGYQAFKDDIVRLKIELQRIPDIISVTTSSSIPGEELNGEAILNNPLIQEEGTNNKVKRIYADHEFLEAYGIEVIVGRNFVELEEMSDSTIMVNVSAAETLGYGESDLDQIINKKFNYYGKPFTVVGVIENVIYRDRTKDIDPLMLFPTIASDNYITIKHVAKEDNSQLFEQIEQVWNANFPNEPFDPTYVADSFDNDIKYFQNIEMRISALAGVSLLVTILGLISTVNEANRQRIKEIGIRKVLGANHVSIVLKFIWDYGKYLIFSWLLAIPIAYYLSTNWLQTFAFRIQVAIQELSLPLVIILLVSSLVIAIQTLKLLGKKSIHSLRVE